jgi:hypothetical protein
MHNMMQNTPPGMMIPGMEAITFFWIAIGVLLCLLAVAFIWLYTRWLKHRRTLPLQNKSQPQEAYHDYQEGYQPQQSLPETYEEAGQSYPYTRDEQSQVQYSEKMPLQS